MSSVAGLHRVVRQQEPIVAIGFDRGDVLSSSVLRPVTANASMFYCIGAQTPTRPGPKGPTPSPNDLHTLHRTAT